MKNAGLIAGRAWFGAGVFKIKEYFAARSPLQVIVIGVLTVILVGLIDLVTGAEISLSIFYLLPIAFDFSSAQARRGHRRAVSSRLHFQNRSGARAGESIRCFPALSHRPGSHSQRRRPRTRGAHHARTAQWRLASGARTVPVRNFSWERRHLVCIIRMQAGSLRSRLIRSRSVRTRTSALPAKCGVSSNWI